MASPYESRTRTKFPNVAYNRRTVSINAFDPNTVAAGNHGRRRYRRRIEELYHAALKLKAGEWAADGRSWFAQQRSPASREGSSLLHINPKGQAHIVHKTPVWRYRPLSSPDGHYLAMILNFGLARAKIINKMASCIPESFLIPRIEVFSCSDRVPLANPAGSVLNSRMLFISTCWSPSCSPAFSLLEDLLLASKLPVFTRRARRKTILHPKFYFFDTGV